MSLSSQVGRVYCFTTEKKIITPQLPSNSTNSFNFHPAISENRQFSKIKSDKR